MLICDCAIIILSCNDAIDVVILYVRTAKQEDIGGFSLAAIFLSTQCLALPPTYVCTSLRVVQVLR